MYVYERIAFKTPAVMRLTSPPSHSMKFHLRLSADPEDAASGCAGVVVALSKRVQAALLDWIPMEAGYE